MYDDAWSTSVSNQLTVLDDNLLALHLAKFAVRQRQRWLLVQVGLMLELLLLLMKWLLGRVMLLMLITKILIVVVVVVVGATAILMMAICVVVLVVSSVVLTVVLLLLIMATDEVIVLVVRWNRSTRCTTSCRSCRWWRYQYVVLIFRKVQIVVDVVVVAAVELLLQDTVGVLDRDWLVTTADCTVEVLILFQLVNQRTSLLLGVTSTDSTLMVLMVILQYPCWATVIVHLLIGLMRVVIVVTAATVGWFQLYVLAAAATTGLMVLVLGRNSLLRRYGVVV